MARATSITENVWSNYLAEQGDSAAGRSYPDRDDNGKWIFQNPRGSPGADEDSAEWSDDSSEGDSSDRESMDDDTSDTPYRPSRDPNAGDGYRTEDEESQESDLGEDEIGINHIVDESHPYVGDEEKDPANTFLPLLLPGETLEASRERLPDRICLEDEGLFPKTRTFEMVCDLADDLFFERFLGYEYVGADYIRYSISDGKIKVQSEDEDFSIKLKYSLKDLVWNIKVRGGAKTVSANYTHRQVVHHGLNDYIDNLAIFIEAVQGTANGTKNEYEIFGPSSERKFAPLLDLASKVCEPKSKTIVISDTREEARKLSIVRTADSQEITYTLEPKYHRGLRVHITPKRSGKKDMVEIELHDDEGQIFVVEHSPKSKVPLAFELYIEQFEAALEKHLEISNPPSRSRSGLKKRAAAEKEKSSKRRPSVSRKDDEVESLKEILSRTNLSDEPIRISSHTFQVGDEVKIRIGNTEHFSKGPSGVWFVTKIREVTETKPAKVYLQHLKTGCNTYAKPEDLRLKKKD